MPKSTAEALEDITEQYDGDADADREFTMFASLQCTSALHGASHMIEAQGSFFQKPFACGRWSDARVAPFEQVGAYAMLQASNTTAQGGLGDVQRNRGSPKAAMLGRSKSISEESNIEDTIRHRGSPEVAGRCDRRLAVRYPRNTFELPNARAVIPVFRFLPPRGFH